MTEQTESSKDNNAEVNPERLRRKGPALFFVIIAIFSLIIYSQHEVVKTIDCTPEIIASKPDVIMLGAWWCSYCYQAKKYFQQQKIHYCEYDVENTDAGKRLYQKHGASAVPILLVGKYQLNGFSKSQVEQALSLLNKPRLNNIPGDL